MEDSGPRKTLQARNSLSTSGPFCFTRQRSVKFTHFRSKGFKLSKYSCQFISPKGGNILERPNRSEYPSHSWRLIHFLNNWAQVSQDQLVLDTIQSYKLEFLRESIQLSHLRVGTLSPHEQSLVQEKVQSMLQKGQCPKQMHPGAVFTRACF